MVKLEIKIIEAWFLTVDEVIQFFAEHHLAKQVKKLQAKSGVAIVMNPSTGGNLCDCQCTSV